MYSGAYGGRRRRFVPYGMPSYRKPKMSKGYKTFRRINKKYPIKDYGRVYPKRGDPETTRVFGASWKEASPEQRQQRTTLGYRGKGGYWGRLVGRGLGSLVGLGDWGAQAGDKAGDWLDSKARSFAESRGYSGHGAYNSLINPVSNDPVVPRMQSSMDETGALNVAHREYILDVQGGSGFNNFAALVNPANPTLFPFLSQFACNFDEYKFNQLIFHYRPVTSDLNVNNAQLGSVIMVADYNAGTQEQFTTKMNMMQYDGAVSAKISEPITFGIECDNTKNAGSSTLFVPPAGYTPAGEDPKTYQLALFQLAVNQSATTGMIGELWVEYSITLRKPKFCTAVGLNTSFLSASCLGQQGNSATNQLGVPANTVIAVPTGTATSSSIQQTCFTQLLTNMNGGTFYVGGAYTDLQSYRKGLLAKAQTLNVWSLTQYSTPSSTMPPFTLMMPDNLSSGTFALSIMGTAAGGGSGGLWTITPSPNVKLLTRKQISAANGDIHTALVLTFQITASAIDINYAGTQQLGTFIQFYTPAGATGGAYWYNQNNPLNDQLNITITAANPTFTNV